MESEKDPIVLLQEEPALVLVCVCVSVCPCVCGAGWLSGWLYTGKETNLDIHAYVY